MSCCHCHKPSQPAKCPEYRRIQYRRDTAANWTSKNPPLAEGEFGYETDTLKAKIGNGKDRWEDLPYWPSNDAVVGDNHIVSDVEPPPGELGQIWIQPNAVPPGFDEDSPIEYSSPPVEVQSNGDPIGLSEDGLTFHQPLIIGAIPVKIAGVEYLIPIIEK
jgi:hypothetical protein